MLSALDVAKAKAGSFAEGPWGKRKSDVSLALEKSWLFKKCAYSSFPLEGAGGGGVLHGGVKSSASMAASHPGKLGCIIDATGGMWGKGFKMEQTKSNLPARVGISRTCSLTQCFLVGQEFAITGEMQAPGWCVSCAFSKDLAHWKARIVP